MLNAARTRELAKSKIIAVLPTVNEAENLPPLADGLFALAVDDNSPDGTGAIADGLAERHPGRAFVLLRQARGGWGRLTWRGSSTR